MRVQRGGHRLYSSHLPEVTTDWQDLNMISGTPKNFVNPILPFQLGADSLCPVPDKEKLPTMRSVSSGIASWDDFATNLGNFLDAFYLYRKMKSENR
jgi:hypothetical protein